MNYIKYGSDWVKFYNIDPLDFGGNSTQKEYLLGGEVIFAFILPTDLVNNMNLKYFIALNSQSNSFFRKSKTYIQLITFHYRCTYVIGGTKRRSLLKHT